MVHLGHFCGVWAALLQELQLGLGQLQRCSSVVVDCGDVRARPESQHFFLIVRYLQRCESGSGWIRNFFLDPELFRLDPGKKQTNKKTKKLSKFNFSCFNCTENTLECSFKLMVYFYIFIRTFNEISEITVDTCIIVRSSERVLHIVWIINLLKT